MKTKHNVSAGCESGNNKANKDAELCVGLRGTAAHNDYIKSLIKADCRCTHVFG